jgi:serine/threonine protein kinase/Tol biopolymer transport system component
VTDDRWQRVKRLFQAAVEQPDSERAAFLASATGDDEALRREVESLLAADAADDGRLEGFALRATSPLAALTASSSARSEEPPTRLSPGHRIGAYEIMALIGAGAMGEVYRARDTRLGREVALKALPPPFAFDPDRLARFRREAQVLASLNHPNIGAIHGFEDSSDVHALVLELVEGPTLADRIARGPLALDEAFAAARQIADALEAAHEKGIIHRDLKPANIKIDGSGAVKVLDFGLAKPVTHDGTRPDLTGAHEGLILGTASYMSPEQARGQSVDRRADIWAFGCVLYEMLTGHLAFPGDTVSDTIARILEREPDWSVLPAATPVAIRRLLFRCLAKHPRQRMKDMGDVRIEIDAIDEVLPAVPRVPVPPRPKTWTRWLPWAAVAALAAVIVGESWRRARTPDDPLAAGRVTLFTNWEGAEEGAAISPDGQFVAFLADHDGEWDIWLRQVGSADFTNLTRDFPPLSASGVIVRKLGFSGDGTQIWFNPGDGKRLMLIPLTGGTPRPFLVEGANTPAWSSDGTRLVYFFKPDDDGTYVADRNGLDPRSILPPAGLKHNNPAWSSDDRWIYFVRGAEPQDEVDVDVWRLRPSGESLERLTAQHAAVNFLAPIDSRTLLFTARDEDWSGPWLWALDVERGLKRRVLPGVDQYTSVAADREGRRVVATVANPSASLWRVPLRQQLVEEADVRPYPLPVPTGNAMAPRFSKTSMFYLSARGTGDGLWRVHDGKGSEVWPDVNGALAEPAAVSRAGDRVAVVVRRDGRRHLWTMAADGTDVRTLAPSLEIEGAAGQSPADWSPDGKWIVAGGRDAQGPALFKIPVDGGAPFRLVEGKWVNPVWSPDGSVIVYAGRSYIGQIGLRAARPDGAPVDLPPVMVRPGGYRFLPDGTGIVFLQRIQGLDFWLLDLRTKSTRQLTQLGNRGALRTFDITPDGRQIVFDRSRQNSNIVLIDLPKR